MTHKRCRKTGKRARVIGERYLTAGRVIEVGGGVFSMYPDLTYFTSYCNVEKAEKEILRGETKLDRLLDGTDE